VVYERGILKSQDVLIIMVVVVIIMWIIGPHLLPYTVLTWLTSILMVVMMALALVAPSDGEEKAEKVDREAA